MQPPDGAHGLEELAGYLRTHSALAAKAQIAIVREVVGEAEWVHGPGDDGAVVTVPTEAAATPGQVVVCGEALLPEFVARDPFGAGVAAVLANVNDLAAMGAVPSGIVDTIVGSPDLAREALRGMTYAGALYEVPIVGGHLTVHEGSPAVSAFGVGHADVVLSTTRVAVGQALIVASSTDGTMREDFPFFRSYDVRGPSMAGDVRLLPALAACGACVAAKDVSMAGAVGSAAMLLEWSRLGVTIDLDALPRPRGVSMAAWLTCFPAYSFLLCAPPDRALECVTAFTERGLEAAVVGVVDDSGLVRLRTGGEAATVLDLSVADVTGLRR
ncbi:MAG TPA: AIR synthase related protein [Nocardioidaceae bacterium]|nr:AIR synthase related protein [Nocardioidaceae bacterium]